MSEQGEATPCKKAKSSAGASASASAAWAQVSAEAGLGGLTVTEAALAAMFNQLKDVEDPIFVVSFPFCHTASMQTDLCREIVENCQDCGE